MTAASHVLRCRESDVTRIDTYRMSKIHPASANTTQAVTFFNRIQRAVQRRRNAISIPPPRSGSPRPPSIFPPARPASQRNTHTSSRPPVTATPLDPLSPRAPESSGPCRAPLRSSQRNIAPESPRLKTHLASSRCLGPTGQASRGASGNWQRRTSTAQSCPARPRSRSRT